uniref:Uncharacterized protein n=1 Tax=Helianthus annuus TaxID=4232 RepID=A0A251SHH9_HELAN
MRVTTEQTTESIDVILKSWGLKVKKDETTGTIRAFFSKIWLKTRTRSEFLTSFHNSREFLIESIPIYLCRKMFKCNLLKIENRRKYSNELRLNLFYRHCNRPIELYGIRF